MTVTPVTVSPNDYVTVPPPPPSHHSLWQCPSDTYLYNLLAVSDGAGEGSLRQHRRDARGDCLQSRRHPHGPRAGHAWARGMVAMHAAGQDGHRAREPTPSPCGHVQPSRSHADAATTEPRRGGWGRRISESFRAGKHLQYSTQPGKWRRCLPDSTQPGRHQLEPEKLADRVG